MTGPRIKQARIEKHMTQRELADKVGITRIALARIESSDVPNMKASTAVAMSKALELPLDFLLCDE